MVKSLPAMWETWVQSLSWEDTLEKEMATTPVFLPGKSHGWLPSMGSQRVRHNWATSLSFGRAVLAWFTGLWRGCSQILVGWIQPKVGLGLMDLLLRWVTHTASKPMLVVRRSFSVTPRGGYLSDLTIWQLLSPKGSHSKGQGRKSHTNTS